MSSIESENTDSCFSQTAKQQRPQHEYTPKEDLGYQTEIYDEDVPHQGNELLEIEVPNKKNKKKRVGRIGFAEVIVVEQVIKSTDEDLEMRRDHWRAIQEKAEDPNTVFSNESSKVNSRVSSAHHSRDGSPTFRGINPVTPPLQEQCADDSRGLNINLLHTELLKLSVQKDLSDPVAESGWEEQQFPGTVSRKSFSSQSLANVDVIDEARFSDKSSKCQADAEAKHIETESAPDVIDSAAVGSNTATVAEAVQLAVCAQTGGSTIAHTTDLSTDVLNGTRDIELEVNLNGDDCETGIHGSSGADSISKEFAGRVHRPDGFDGQEHDAAAPPEAQQHESVANAAAAARLQDPPGPGCPDLNFPSVDAFVSQKQQHEIFSRMAQNLLAYIDLWPKARKAGNNLKALNMRRDSKVSKDLAYALQRWLVHTWKAGIKIKNAFHMGELMAADKALLHGPNPLIEQRVLASMEADNELSIQLTAVADISVDDWLEMTARFKNRHLIGDKFFPDEEYSVLTGLGALLNQGYIEAHEQTHTQVNDFNPVDTEADEHERRDLWDEDSTVGHSIGFAAKIQPKDWDVPYHSIDGSPETCKDINFQLPDSNEMQSLDACNTRTQRVPSKQCASGQEDAGCRVKPGVANCNRGGEERALKMDYISSKTWFRNRHSKLAHSKEYSPQCLKIGRAISEPLPQVQRIGGDLPAKDGDHRPATSEAKVSPIRKYADKSYNARSGAAVVESALERDLNFQRFTKAKTGRTRLSERKLEMLKFAYRDELQNQKKIRAAKSFTKILMDLDKQIEVQENHKIVGKCQAGKSLIGIQPSAENAPSCLAKCGHRAIKQLRKDGEILAVQSHLKEFKDVNVPVNFVPPVVLEKQSRGSILGSLDNSSCSSDVEENIDEFLRPSMFKLLKQDSDLANSLGLTCVASNKSGAVSKFHGSELHKTVGDSFRLSRELDLKFSPSAKAAGKLVEMKGNGSRLHQPSFRLPDLRNRASNRGQLYSAQHLPQSYGPQSDQMPENTVAGRRSAHSAFGYLEGRANAMPSGGADLLRSPYAQKLQGYLTSSNTSKKLCHKTGERVS